MLKRDLEGTNLTVSLEKDGDKFVGCIYIAGEFWDWRELGENEECAMRWFIDPIAEDRAREIRQSEREEARALKMAKEASPYDRINKGRRIGPKSGAA